jgi:RNA polymerase sigma factor (TIGR02999 family)
MENSFRGGELVCAADKDEITRLLVAAGDGAVAAVNAILPHVYDELRQLAARCMAAERPGVTLQTTALVHEAYLRLVNQETAGFGARRQFLAAAATVMRRILVDHARSRRREKRGGRAGKVTLDEALAVFERDVPDIADLDEALTALAKIDSRKARLVELRFFAGVGLDEAAKLLGVTQRTAERDWRFARAWLRDRLETKDPP